MQVNNCLTAMKQNLCLVCLAVSHYTKNSDNMVIKEERLQNDVLVIQSRATVDLHLWADACDSLLE